MPTTLGNISTEDASDEQSDGPKRGIGRFLMENLLAPTRSSGAFVGYGYLMAFLVCYSRIPPEDQTDDRAIYLDQAFYKMIFDHCRDERAGFAVLKSIADLRYKSPTFVVDADSLEMLVCELNRIPDLGLTHSQVTEFRNVVATALQRKCSLTISGDMYPEL